MTSVPQHDRTEGPSAVRRPRATGHDSESDLQVFNQGRTVVDDGSASAHRVRARRPQPRRGADV
jgi:hypothetical protein